MSFEQAKLFRASRAVLASSTLLATVAAPSVALAHHAMGGKMPSTFFEGFMSGLAHPVIGPDHLAMTLLIGAYAGLARRGIIPAIAFVAASLIGCALHIARLDFPGAETVLAVSLLIAGTIAWFVARQPHWWATAALGVMGVLHGYAYGESIVGAERSPLVAYLLGFSLVQLGIAGLVWTATRNAASSRQITVIRALGVASALVGVVAVVGHR